jgi:formate/nitrite transporter FocA (FNT family)
MFLLPIGMMLTATSAAPIGMSQVFSNLFFVTVGNIAGGTLLVALVYWFVYLRGRKP